MDLRREIAQKIDALLPDQEARVLQFVASLSASAVKGRAEPISAASQAQLDSESARE
jgi:hypothetical protein